MALDVSVYRLLFFNLSLTYQQVIHALQRIGRPIYGFDPDTYGTAKKPKGQESTHAD